MYSKNDRNSFDHLKEYLELAKGHCLTSLTTVFGNKNDDTVNAEVN